MRGGNTMLKTNTIKAIGLTINSKVAVETGTPFYTRTTRGLVKKVSYVVVEVKAITELDADTLSIDVVTADAIGVIIAAKNEDVEVVVETK
jgi:glucose-6-phosphate 1-dehydrogenase